MHDTPNAIDRDEILSIDAVTALSRDVAAEYDPRLEVIGVTSTAGESSRVEVFVTLRGCHPEPCVLLVNLNRQGHEAFERDLRAQLRRALGAHNTLRPTSCSRRGRT
jgi:hypothetical protein